MEGLEQDQVAAARKHAHFPSSMIIGSVYGIVYRRVSVCLRCIGLPVQWRVLFREEHKRSAAEKGESISIGAA